jgi:haloalkane dehalogenase
MDRRAFFEVGASAIVASGLASFSTTNASAATGAAAKPAKPMDAAAFHAARRFAELRFGRIAYFERGQGDAALFIHGFPLNGFQWRGAIDRLSEHRRCIAPDMLGLGYTEPAKGQSVGPDAQVEMLAALLDHLKVTSIDLIANDSGGAVAQLFAIRHPKRVRTLLLTNCDVEINSPPPQLQPVLDGAHAGTFADGMLRQLITDKEFARSDKGIGGGCYTYRVHPTNEAIDTYIEPLTRNKERCALADAYGLALEKNPLAGAEAQLKRLTMPVRLVWGEADDIFPLRDAAYIASLFPNSRGIRRVYGARLFFPEEFPEVIAEEARALWGVA